MAELKYGNVVGVFSTDGKLRLDIGTWGLKKDVPASHDSWATRLVIRRLDGASEGVVADDHAVGIFSEDGRVRLDIGNWAMQKEVPASHESRATQLVLRRLDGSGDGQPVCYGDVIGIFSEDGKTRLDIGIDAVKKEIPADHESRATKFYIRLNDSVIDFEIERIEYDLDHAQILGTGDFSLDNQSVCNKTDMMQTFHLKGSRSVTETSSWSDTLGIKTGVKTSVSVQVPMFVGTGVELSAESSQAYTWSQSVSRTRTVEWDFPLVMAPHCSGGAMVTVQTGNLIVPYVLHGKYVYKSGRRQEGEVSGTYMGSNCSNVRAVYIGQTPVDNAVLIENIDLPKMH